MASKAKIAGTIIIFGISFLCCLIPSILVKCLKRTLGTSPKFLRAISLLNCFAGGVFFATSVLDLLPEARESMETVLKEHGDDTEFALTECLMGAGFLLVLFLEQLALRCCSKAGDPDPHNHDFKVESNRALEIRAGKANGYDQYDDPPRSRYSPIEDDNKGKHSAEPTKPRTGSNTSYGTVDGATNVAFSGEARTKTVNQNNEQVTSFHAGVPGEDNRIDESTALGYQQSRRATSQTKTLRSLILLSALSFHMVFDGLALGLLQDESEIWSIVLALCIHKALVFFTIGLQLLELVKAIWKIILLALFFSFISPLGVFIGIALTDGDDLAKETVSAVLQSFATGTFVYVTFFEILQKELNAGDHDLLKVVCTVVGFGLVAVIKLTTHDI